MTKLQRKLTASVAALSLVISVGSQAAMAATTLTISGNGSGADSEVDFDANRTTDVIQNNVSNVQNSVKVKSNTGKNDANDNTSGEVKIKTGDAVGVVTVRNMLNSNHAEVDCCEYGDTDVLIEGNGSDSDNDAELDKTDTTNLYQTNVANVRNNVAVDAKTGENEADDNTGANVEIKTGDAGMEVMVETVANSNTARIGRNGSDTGSLSARIIGNGTDSDNDIDLDLNRNTMLTQANDANVHNKVKADLVTGKNDANDNTNGEVEIDTGDAIGFADIYNTLNFNTADVDCGCMMSSIIAKINENGSDSESDIEAEFDEDLDLFQNNADHMRSYVDMELETGRNDADDNTGDANSDPSISTGNAYGDAVVENVGNSNTFGQNTGQGTSFEIPTDHGFNLSLNIDFAALIAALGLDL